MTRQPPTSIRVELDRNLLDAFPPSRAAKVGRLTTAAVRAEHARVGLRGAPSVTVASGDPVRPISIGVNGETQGFPAWLLADVWRAVAPTALRNAHGERVTGVEWLPRYAASLNPSAAAAWRAIADSVARLTVEVIRLHPASLLTPGQIAAFAAGRKLPRSVDDAVVEFVLRGLLELGVSLAERNRVLDVIAEEAGLGHPPGDLLETVYTRLRSQRVDVRISPDDLGELVGRLDAAREWPVYAEEVSLQDEFLALERAVFHETGLRIPETYLVPADDLRRGMIEIRVGGVPALPLPLSLSERHVEGDDADSEVRKATRSQIASLVGEAIVEAGDRLLGIEDVEFQLASLRRTFPDLVRAALTAFSAGDVTRLLRGLLREGLSIRDLRTILDRLLTYEEVVFDERGKVVLDRAVVVAHANGPATRFEFARAGIAANLAHQCADDGRLTAISVAHVLEGRLSGLTGRGRRLTDRQRESVRRSASEAVERATSRRARPVVLTTTAARAALREIIAGDLPRLPVLARSEVPADLEIEYVDEIRG